ncbi:hypothetical protein Daus18300_006802 [Diaporthe australafricana]|uniref:Heterokaryon incompatibility domain-containing protein n=1 Tax=Diaporthe australafricana TaxID=127596 RepID=A0ABR3WS27_9PEZI
MSQAAPKSRWLDDASLQEVKAKLDNCVGNHQCDSAQNAELPKRLLDLQVPGKSPDFIKLVKTAEIVVSPGQRVNYVALSYCWGRTTAFTTTSQSLNSRVKGFRTAEMPRTLSDTAQVARELGYRYLWIDALCILQEGRKDPVAAEDWRHESARMHLIYGNASLCIVAAGASSSDQGLRHKDPRVIKDTGIVEWSAQGKIPIGCEPISSRAWCFQEWLLSNRLLVFASTGVYYVCDRYTLDTADPAYGFRFPKSRPGVAAINAQATLSRDSWQTMAMNYSARNMSEPSDKLPALSGMAKRYADLMGWPAGDYHAGLWRATLISDLLWSREEGLSSVSATPDPAKTGRQHGRAPSWSWTSMDGSITYLTFPGGCVPRDVSIQSCGTMKPSVKDADPFGQVVSGRLVIVAPYMTTWARPFLEEPGKLYFQLFDANDGFVDLLTVDDPVEMDESRTNVPTSPIMTSFPRFQPAGPSNLSKGIMVHCLGLMVKQDGEQSWAGIAVRELVDKTYARVGEFCITGFTPEKSPKEFVIV